MNLRGSGLEGNVIKIKRRVLIGQVGGGRQHAVSQRLHAHHEFSRAGSADEMAQHAFDTAYRNLWGVVTKHTFDRHGLDAIDLLQCFTWDEPTFLVRTEGSAIRRIGFEQWRRNVAIALGNAESTDAIRAALAAALEDPSELVREHVQWALAQHQ